MMFLLSGIGFKSPLCIPMRIRPAVFLTTEQKKEKNRKTGLAAAEAPRAGYPVGLWQWR
jgi:hypothetical protein